MSASGPVLVTTKQGIPPKGETVRGDRVSCGCCVTGCACWFHARTVPLVCSRHQEVRS